MSEAPGHPAWLDVVVPLWPYLTVAFSRVYAGGMGSSNRLDPDRPKMNGKTGRAGADERAPFMAAFINSYSNLGNITLACRQANITRTRVYDWYRGDMDGFKAVFDEAHQEACDMVEAEIHRRGVAGYQEPVIYQGKLMGRWVDGEGNTVLEDTEGALFIPLTVTKHSDILLIFLAKALMPDKYRDKFEGANLGGGPTININMVRNDVVQMIAGMPEDELRRLAERGRKQIEAPKGVSDGLLEAK